MNFCTFEKIVLYSRLLPILILLIIIYNYFRKKNKKSNIDLKNERKKLIIKIVIIVILGYFWMYFANFIQNPTVDKPIIYLYSNSEQVVSIKLNNVSSITHSYPKYIDGWSVLAQPGGNLIDLKTNKKLYALYYENNANFNAKLTDEGFIIKGKDTIKFFEEKLSLLGLNDKEKEEFIIYWLPKLENNKYNYIRFADNDEINRNMVLDINPKPDTIIRVLMIYKKLDYSRNVIEQKIVTPERNGFTVVEWGGIEVK